MKWWILAGAGLAGIAVAAFLFARHKPPVEPKPAPSAPTAATEAILIGRVAPRTVITVASPIEGVLENFFAEPGAEVIQDQLLGRVRNAKADSAIQQAQTELDQAQVRLTQLNGDQLSARLEVSRTEAEQSRAQADLDRLQKSYERQKGLWAAGATARLTFEKSEKDYNDAKAAADKQQTAAKQAAEHSDSIAREIETANRTIAEKAAAIERAKQGAAAGELHSPADGIVVARHGQPGDAVDPSSKLVEVATELTALEAIATPDASTLPRIHANQPASVHFGDEEIAGVVQEVRGQDVIVYFNTSTPITRLDQSAQVKIKF